jgi:hypothetical protein
LALLRSPVLGRRWRPRWGLPSARDRQVDVRVDLGQKVGYDANDDPAEWVTDDGTRPGPGRRAQVASLTVGPRSSALNQLAPRQGTVQPMEVCVNYTGSTYTNRPERFAQVYAWQGAYGTLSEKSGNDHTLGIGYNNGSSWSASGSSTLSFSASATRGQLADTNVYNAVNYRDFYNSCYPGFWRKPIGYYALLTNFTLASHVKYGACTRYTGGVYGKTAGRNITYSTGVNIGGYSVNAQSGWTSETTVSWTVTAPTYLCGSTSNGWASSPMAEAHAG